MNNKISICINNLINMTQNNEILWEHVNKHKNNFISCYCGTIDGDVALYLYRDMTYEGFQNHPYYYFDDKDHHMLIAGFNKELDLLMQHILEQIEPMKHRNKDIWYKFEQEYPVLFME